MRRRVLLKELAPRHRPPPPEVVPVAAASPPEPGAPEVKDDAGQKGGMDALIQLLNGGDVDGRLRAAREIAKLGPRAAAAAETLVTLLQDLSPQVQSAAIEALGSIGAKAIPHLVLVLGIDDIDCIVGAARALSMMGHVAREALPALEKWKEHEDPRIREAVKEACARISG